MVVASPPKRFVDIVTFLPKSVMMFITPGGPPTLPLFKRCLSQARTLHYYMLYPTTKYAMPSGTFRMVIIFVTSME
jgi:hypothetical protein